MAIILRLDRMFFMCGLFALILFCISLIFDYGCELQQEVDEMI